MKKPKNLLDVMRYLASIKTAKKSTASRANAVKASAARRKCTKLDKNGNCIIYAKTACWRCKDKTLSTGKTGTDSIN